MGIGRRCGKKLTSGVLSLAMMLGVFSGMSFTVFADEDQPYDLYVGDTQVTYLNMSSFGGDEDAFKYVETDTGNTLTLTDANITETIKYTGSRDLTIDLVGDNTIDVADGDGIYVEDANLIIKGDGALSVKGSESGIYVPGNGAQITFFSCDVTAEGVNEAAIIANKYTQRGGIVAATGVGVALTCETGILELTGELTAVATGTGSNCYGIYVLPNGSFSIVSGCSLTASGNTSAVFGTVKNADAGMGWTTTDGSGVGTPIAANETGSTLSFKKVQFPSPYTVIDKIEVTVTVPEIGSSFSEGDSIGCEISQSADYSIVESQFNESANPVEGDSEYEYQIKFAPRRDGYVFPAGSADVTVTANGVNYTVDKDSFSSDLLTFSAKIKTAPKQDQVISGVEDSYTVKYGDKLQIEPVASGNGTISVSGNTGVIDYTQVSGTNKFDITTKKAGTATITVNAGATPYFKSASKVITITVTKADSSLTKAPAAKSLTYTGSAQALVEAGTAENGTLQYALGTDAKTAPTSGWGTTIPTGKNAGTYYVWYKVEGGANYNGVDAACVSVKIAKAKATLSKTPAAKSLTYTGSAQALVDQGTATAGSLVYAAGKDAKTAPTSGWGTTIPTGKDAGTYYVWYKVEGDDNITGIAAKCITVKIAKATAEVSKAPTAKTLKENDKDQALVNAGTAKNGTLKYAIGKDAKTAPTSGWSTTIPTGKDFGTYYVWYKAEGDSNYNDSVAKCVTVKIAEDTSRISIKNAKVEFEFKEYTYVGIPVRPRAAVFVNGVQLVGKTDFTGDIKDNDKPGTGTVTINGIGKYKNSITKTFKIVQASVVCGKTFETGVEGAKDWKSSDKTIATVDSNGKITGKQAGTSTITYKYDGETRTFTIQVLFKDVIKSSDFWYEPTYYLSGLGVVKGYDKQTKFKPDADCTRAQMVTFLWRLNGSPKPASTATAFTDIKSGDYYYNAVLWAVEKGITTGTSKTTFGPSGVCTRGQTVTFLWRMAGKPAVGDAKNPFSDVKKGDYFYDAVIWASKMKIVAGYNDGTFKPSGKCARRQMVTFLYKYDKYVNGKG